MEFRVVPASHRLTKTSSFSIGAGPAGFLGEKIAAIGDVIERAQSTDNALFEFAQPIDRLLDTAHGDHFHS